MNFDEMYITLSSNVITKENPSNSLSEYITILNQRLKLEGKWVVGISEISYTKSWYNILETHPINFYDEFGNKYEPKIFKEDNETVYDFNINSGYYESEQVLIDSINLELRKIKFLKAPQIVYNKINNKIFIIPGSMENSVKLYPSFGEEINSLLGITRRDIDNLFYKTNNDFEFTKYEFKRIAKNKINEAFHPIEITRGYHSLYVYSNIVYPSYVGNTCSQILRVVEVPNNIKFGEQCVIRYENPQYRPVILSEINSIEIVIKDDSDNLIPFKFGRVRIDLHLKKL